MKPPPDHEFIEGPGQPMRCLLCGGKTESYCGPVHHQADCKHYDAGFGARSSISQEEIDSLLGFNDDPPKSEFPGPIVVIDRWRYLHIGLDTPAPKCGCVKFCEKLDQCPWSEK